MAMACTIMSNSLPPSLPPLVPHAFCLFATPKRGSFICPRLHIKVAKYYQKDANIKLVDAGNVRMSEMPGNDERKLGLLRHCDLLVHVARCFDLYAPKPYTAWGVTDDDVGDTTEQETRARAKEEEEKEEEKVIDWPLSATPLADVKSARADMASVDLHFIQERHRRETLCPCLSVSHSTVVVCTPYEYTS